MLTSATASPLRWHIGDVTVTCVVEIGAREPLERFFPAAAGALTDADRAWLQPNYLDENEDVRTSIQSFLVESDGVRILVDTCVGNGKPRLYEPLSMLETDYLERLASAGCAPADVDLVVCTHLHFDHVGWNTRWVEGAWVPTFDRARYVFSPAEWQFWKDDPDAQPQFGSAAVLQDSVWPLARAGRVDLREPGFVLAPGVSLGAGHGHTPGHLIVLIESDGQRAVITGDSIHSPVQLVDPGWHGRADLDLPASIEFRRALLAEAAANDRVVFGTHFPDPCAGAVVATRRGYRFEPVPAR